MERNVGRRGNPSRCRGGKSLDLVDRDDGYPFTGKIWNLFFVFFTEESESHSCSSEADSYATKGIALVQLQIEKEIVA